MKVRIEKLVNQGKGLARFEGKIIFVEGVLEGEVVRVVPTKGKRDFVEAGLAEVIEPSPDRRVPACPHFGDCGGCDAQYLSHEAQERAKSAMVVEGFSRQAGIVLSPPNFVSSEAWQSRNRVQIHSNGRFGGFKRRASNEVLAVPHCKIVSEGLKPFLQSNAASEGRETFLDPRLFEIAGTTARVTLLNKTISFDRSSFFQNNISTFEKALSWLKQALNGKSGDLIELYAGCGVLSATVGDPFRSLTLVEEDKRNSSLAQKNIDHQDLTILGMTTEDFVKKTKIPRPSETLVIVDPPRDGLSPQVRDWLCKHKPQHLVYVSCNPASQARDFKDLVQAGYHIETWALWDFYPQTWHIETCMVAIRNG